MTHVAIDIVFLRHENELIVKKNEFYFSMNQHLLRKLLI